MVLCEFVIRSALRSEVDEWIGGAESGPTPGTRLTLRANHRQVSG